MMGVAGALLFASPVMSADQNPPTALARHQAERFKPDGEQVYGSNRLMRCEPLPPEQREECVRRMQGEGSQKGTVEDGGILRELVTPSAPVK
jgi:hypothetical protein